jgi:large subunit ribosomal protein L4
MASVKFVSASGTAATRDVDTSTLTGPVRLRMTRQAVIDYEANQRQGNHSTLRRGEVNGSRKKLWRQKGTGRARIGDRKTPQRRGGGVIGPKPRDYSRHIPRKVRRAALRSAIMAKFKDGEIAILEAPVLEAPKTRVVSDLLRALDIHGTVLLVTGESDPVLYKSARNLAGVTVRSHTDLNALEVLKHRNVVIADQALAPLMTRLSHGSA